MIDPRNARLAQVLPEICRKYGLNSQDFIRAEQETVPFDLTDCVRLEFRAPTYDDALRKLAGDVHRQLADPFVGDVTRAAAPNLSAAAKKLADAILQPTNRVVYVDARVFTHGMYL